MAALLAILKALRLLSKRELGTFRSLGLNNLFLFAALLTYGSLASGLVPVAAIPFFILFLLLILFPLSSDPLGRIPRSRSALWPLTRRQWISLRVASLAVSPVLWIALAVLLLTRQFAFAVLFLVAAVPAQALSVAGTRLTRRIPELHPQRHVPQFPGKLGGLVGLNIREILSLLDFYAALLFCVAAILYRLLKSHPDSDAYAPMAMMVALSLSTYTQCCFGLDSGAGMARYRLLPLRGWQILWAKDAAFLGTLCVLAAPTGSGIIAGLTFGLVVIAAGRYPSLALQLPLRRWRFAGGDIRFTLLQFVTAPTLGFAASRDSLWFLCVAVVLYLISLIAGGWYWEKKNSIARIAKIAGIAKI